MVSLQILDTFVAVPSKEDKNSLYLVVENFDFTKGPPKNGLASISIRDQAIQIFIAQQFD